MKKIKRTITVKKVEFISNIKPDHELNFEICPFCHSQIHAITPANSSAVEIPAAELPFKLTGNSEIESKGDQND